MDLPTINFNRSPNNYETFMFQILHRIRLVEIENIILHTARRRCTMGFQNCLSSSKKIHTIPFTGETVYKMFHTYILIVT